MLTPACSCCPCHCKGNSLVGLTFHDDNDVSAGLLKYSVPGEVNYIAAVQREPSPYGPTVAGARAYFVDNFILSQTSYDISSGWWYGPAHTRSSAHAWSCPTCCCHAAWSMAPPGLCCLSLTTPSYPSTQPPTNAPLHFSSHECHCCPIMHTLPQAPPSPRPPVHSNLYACNTMCTSA